VNVPAKSEVRTLTVPEVISIAGAISFQDFQPVWSWSTNVTDRRHAIPRFAV